MQKKTVTTKKLDVPTQLQFKLKKKISFVYNVLKWVMAQGIREYRNK